MKSSKLALALALGVVAISGCIAGEQEVEDSEGTGLNTEPAYVLSGAKWPSPRIPVCWEATPSNQATERGWVKSAIEDTWEAASAVDFVGWGACNGDSQGVRIKVQDVGPYVSRLGRYLKGRSPGLVLNFTFNNWERDCRPSDERRGCIRATAVHEFGHALGFSHEQNRNDTPDSCEDAPQGEDGDTKIGAWDLRSVMNYCNPRWNNGGVLSDGDKAAVRQLYGR